LFISHRRRTAGLNSRLYQPLVRFAVYHSRADRQQLVWPTHHDLRSL